MGIHARVVLLLCTCLALTTALTAQSNVLVIIGDDLGVDSVGCYGLGLGAPPTPNIDALAAGGVRFDRAYACPACSPTRAAFMTGRYGFRTGVTTTLGGGDPGIDPTETLLPTALQNSGYARALIGKWHLGTRYGVQTPNTLGWPYFAGVIDSGVIDYFRWPRDVNGQVATSTVYTTTAQVDDALAWIGTQTTPWLLVLSFCTPHGPFHAPPPQLHSRNLTGLDPAVTPRPFFEAMVESMDREIGRLLATLPPATRANTNILLFGDNGTDAAVAPAPLPPTHVKGSLYEPGIRVPLIVNGPAVVAPGRASAALVSAVDLFPTILELCGTSPASTPRPLDGISIRPLLANTATSVRDHVYADMSSSPFGGGYTIVSRTHGLLRFLWATQQRQELYNVGADPLELSNMLGTPLPSGDAAEYQRLFGILRGLRGDGWVEDYGTPCTSAVATPWLRAQTMPTSASHFIVQFMNLSPSALFAITALGTSRTTSVFGPLPVRLDGLGMTGCTLENNVDFGWTFFPNPQIAQGFIPLFIRPGVDLLGVDFYLQGFVVDAAANPGQVINTNGLHCTIGL